MATEKTTETSGLAQGDKWKRVVVVLVRGGGAVQGTQVRTIRNITDIETQVKHIQRQVTDSRWD